MMNFQRRMFIGSVLGKYNLGIGDAFIAFRIEQFIRDGLLEPVTPNRNLEISCTAEF